VPDKILEENTNTLAQYLPKMSMPFDWMIAANLKTLPSHLGQNVGLGEG